MTKEHFKKILPVNKQAALPFEKHKLTLKVEARTFIPGTVRENRFEEIMIFPVNVNNKFSLLNELKKHFGKCTGVIELGYSFEGVDVGSDGSRLWWETNVTILDGAYATKNFKLE